PVQPGVPRALRSAAAAVPRARPPAGPRLARSAAHRRRLRPGCLLMAATGVERAETIQSPRLSEAKSRAHLSTNAKAPATGSGTGKMRKSEAVALTDEVELAIRPWHGHVSLPTREPQA